jgi:hypothetical protein
MFVNENTLYGCLSEGIVRAAERLDGTGQVME